MPRETALARTKRLHAETLDELSILRGAYQRECVETQRLRDRCEDLYRTAEEFGHQMVTAMLTNATAPTSAVRLDQGKIPITPDQIARARAQADSMRDGR